MIMLGPDLPCLPRMYDFMIFLYQLGEFILPTSIQLLVPDASRWQAYFTYLYSKCLCKDSIDKMHGVLILDVCFDAFYQLSLRKDIWEIDR